MTLIDRLMRWWSSAEERRRLCTWCRERPRSPETHDGLFCSPECQQDDASAQAFSM